MDTCWITLFFAFFFVFMLVAISVILSRGNRTLRQQNLTLRGERETIYDFVHHIGEVFADAEAMDTTTLINRILFFAVTTARAATGAVYLLDRERDRLVARAVSGLFPPLYDPTKVEVRAVLSDSEHLESLVKSRPVQLNEGLVGTAAAIGSGVLIEDAEMDARVPAYQEEFLKIHSLIVAPMRFGNEVLGVLVLINRTDEAHFTSADFNLLQSMADQASVPVHYAGLKDALEQKRQLDRGMQAARQIQSSLLPRELPALDTLRIAACNVPALDIGGDYYDVIKLNDDLLGIAIADVSGKGIGGAMMMAVCQGVLRARAPLQPSPAGMLSELNRVLSANLAEDMFITMLYLVVHLRTGEVTFARAGHERPLLFRHDSQKIETPNASGIAIGLADAELFDNAIADEQLALQKGDLLVIYTDGVTEAQNSEKEEWGLDRLCDLIHKNSEQGTEAVIEQTRLQIEQFVGAQPQYDDLTLLAIQMA